MIKQINSHVMIVSSKKDGDGTWISRYFYHWSIVFLDGTEKTNCSPTLSTYGLDTTKAGSIESAQVLGRRKANREITEAINAEVLTKEAA